MPGQHLASVATSPVDEAFGSSALSKATLIKFPNLCITFDGGRRRKTALSNAAIMQYLLARFWRFLLVISLLCFAVSVEAKPLLVEALSVSIEVPSGWSVENVFQLRSV